MEENNSSLATYTMDYEKSEIVVTIYTNNTQVETCFTEKDIISMKNWFELAKRKKGDEIGWMKRSYRR